MTEKDKKKMGKPVLTPKKNYFNQQTVQGVPVCWSKYTTSVNEYLFKVLLSNQYTQLSTFVSNPFLY